jgi:subtilisin family serine protease
MKRLRIGIVDTGVNGVHSHVRGRVGGCRIALAPDGRIVEDDEWSDATGHGTAVAAVIRAALPDAELYAVRVFDAAAITYPSLVARGLVRAAANGCTFVNVSIAMPPGPGADVVAAACDAVLEAGAIVVASAPPEQPGSLPAALPGVYTASADDTLAFGEVRRRGPYAFVASGRPRDLAAIPRDRNMSGHSFACAHALVHLVRERLDVTTPARRRTRRPS